MPGSARRGGAQNARDRIVQPTCLPLVNQSQVPQRQIRSLARRSIGCGRFRIAENPLSRIFVDSTVLAVICRLLTLARQTAPQRAPGARFPRATGDASATTSKRICTRRSCWSISPTSEVGACGTSRACSVSRRGRAPRGFILQKRVDRAKDLLRRPQLQLAEVGLSCGFADQSHFTTSFRKATGRTPLRSRQEFE